MIPALFFYLFAAICVASAVMVIASRNPVHSVLFLILAFVNASGLFILMGAEFLAMILVVVYVGAVAVLFLFVIMMLDVDFAALADDIDDSGHGDEQQHNHKAGINRRRRERRRDNGFSRCGKYAHVPGPK